MVDSGWVDRIGRGEYRITTYGVENFREKDLPRIRALAEGV
jgi:predicted transcriptional regulator